MKNGIPKILEKIEINDISLTLSYFIGIIILITLEIYIRLLSPTKVMMKGVACTYDALIQSDLYTIPLFIMPFIMYYIINVLKNEFNIMRVIKKVNIKQIWFGCIRELFIIDLIFTIYISLVTIIAGLMLTQRICNWSEENSFGFNVVGKPIYDYPSFTNIIIIYALSVFCLIFVLGIIILFVWWYMKSPISGMIVAFILLFLDSAVHATNILYSRYVMSFRIYKYGIDIVNQIVYPICLSIIIFAITTVLVRRRDFLDKL